MFSSAARIKLAMLLSAWQFSRKMNISCWAWLSKSSNDLREDSFVNACLLPFHTVLRSYLKCARHFTCFVYQVMESPTTGGAGDLVSLEAVTEKVVEGWPPIRVNMFCPHKKKSKFPCPDSSSPKVTKTSPSPSRPISSHLRERQPRPAKGN